MEGEGEVVYNVGGSGRPLIDAKRRQRPALSLRLFAS
jgi:hypothetical protein